MLPLIIFFGAALALITSIMIAEYISFKRAAEQLVHVRKDYQTYMQEIKEKLDELNSRQLEFEKKKSPEVLARVSFSSENNGHDKGMVLIQRDAYYLKKSALAYAIKKGEHNALLALYNSHESLPCEVDGSLTHIVKSKSSMWHQEVQRPPHAPTFAVQWPIAHSLYWISSFFGPRKKKDATWGFHYGLDMAALKGTPVKAVASGKVIEVSYSPRGFGKSIVIQHDERYKTRYAHLDQILVYEGQLVNIGQLIGKVGDTGLVRGKNASHLHLEVIEFGKRINPLYIL